MLDVPTRPRLALFLALASLAPAASAQRVPAQPVPDVRMPHDDQSGRYLSFETGVIAPLALSQDGSRLYTINPLGGRIAVFDTATWTRVDEIAIGLGAASIARRPGTNELWVADRVESCVTVIDPSLGAIVRTIRVGAEPYGIAFDGPGVRAFVTCAGANKVDVVRTSDFTRVKSLAIAATSPRGIAFANGAAWCAPFLSGNGTAPKGTPADPYDVRTVELVTGPGTAPLPDRDLFAVRPGATPAGDRVDSSATRTGLGTILFNVHARPGTNELWIPNTDALNALHVGENGFVDGQLVSNRITIVDTGGQAAPRFVDLDAIAPAGTKCAQPTGLAFDPVRPRVYVCAYGSDLVAVLHVAANGTLSWDGSIVVPPKQAYPRGSGPRACLVDPQGQWLYVYAMQDKAVTRVDLASLPATGVFQVTSAPGASTGFELLSGAERLGRHLFNDATLSKSGTSSCASCHVDGHTDGLAWDLSRYLDPQPTPANLLDFPVDVKGPLVTQSLRRMAEVGPYHWRGEKRRMEEFNASFADLLKHEVGGVPSDIAGDFQYLTHYVERLAILPNPREELDRSLTTQQERGARIFATKPVLNGLRCADCHVLPLGSSGEVVAETPTGMLESADVPSLRGVGDELAPPWWAGGAFGQRTETGAGLTHGGAMARPRDEMLSLRRDGSGLHRFAITPSEAEDVEAFLMAFDTGLAPAAAFQATANATNALAVQSNELAFLVEQCERGNCDLIALRTPTVEQGAFVQQTAQYDLATHAFLRASATLPPMTAHALILEALAGRPVTFLGVPLGCGLPLARDRDMDGLYDLDEHALGTGDEFGNMDLDAFPDGYEVRWGMDPFAFDAAGSAPDHQPPHLVRPARLVYATTNTIKFDFATDEPCQLLVAYNGQYPVQRLPLAAHKDREFSVVINDLEPDTDYRLDLTLKDPNGNVAIDSSNVFRTLPRVTAVPARIDAIAMQVTSGSGSDVAAVQVSLLRSNQAAAGYGVQASLYYRRGDGTLQLVHADQTVATDATGVASFALSLAGVTGAGAGELVFAVQAVDAPPGNAAHVRAYDATTTATAAY